jgi:hypothetical protein
MCRDAAEPVATHGKCEQPRNAENRAKTVAAEAIAALGAGKYEKRPVGLVSPRTVEQSSAGTKSGQHIRARARPIDRGGHLPQARSRGQTLPGSSR